MLDRDDVKIFLAPKSYTYIKPISLCRRRRSASIRASREISCVVPDWGPPALSHSLPKLILSKLNVITLSNVTIHYRFTVCESIPPRNYGILVVHSRLVSMDLRQVRTLSTILILETRWLNEPNSWYVISDLMIISHTFQWRCCPCASHICTLDM